MALTNVWIASFFGPPPAAIGATPVWIAPNDGTVPSAVQSVIAGYFTAVAGASPVWIAGFFAPPPAAIGATPICISGWSGSGGGGGATTSVWSASDAAANGMTLSNGGLTATATLASWNSIRGTIGKTTGKLYFEVVNSVLATSEFAGVGFATADTNSAGMSGVYLGNFNFSGAAYLFGGQFNNAGSYNYGFGTINAVAGDVLSVAIDLDAGRGWIAYNNVWQGSGDPATGANPAFTVSLLLGRAGKAIFPGMAFYSTGGVWTLQPTAASQKYAPPSGFTPWG